MELIELTRHLISLPSYLDEKIDEHVMGEFIYDYLRTSSNWQVEKQPVEGKRFNVIAHDGHPPRLMFCCHLDTVPPSGKWKHEPMGGEIEEGRMYGLGACDMKGGTAALLYALQSFTETCGLFLLFDVDEEYNFKGVLKFLEKYQVHPKLAVLPEPGLKIGNGHRGQIEVNFKVRGKSAHAARPDLGMNAILGTSRAVEHLMETLELYQHPILGKTSCNLAWLKGGIERDDGEIKCQTNKIPDLAEAVLDIRPASSELRAGTVLDTMANHLEANGYQLEAANIKLDYGSLYIPPERFVEFEKIARAVLGQVEYDDISLGGYGEGQLLNEKLGIDCVYFGPGPKEMAHEADEFVSVMELEQASRVFSKLIEQYCY
jgi:acetylornithine deacetylase/succinyl-diaminopimelate desuccinylase-like protein